MQLKSNTQSDYAVLSDAVSAAMETGNAARARTILREADAEFPAEVERVRGEVLKDYGIRV